MKDRPWDGRASPILPDTSVHKRPITRLGYPCHYCNSRAKPLTLDHIVPRSRGGTNDYRNLVAACKRCNQDKGNRLPTCTCERCQHAIDFHWQWLMEQRGDRAELLAKVDDLYRSRWDSPT
jgi:hypothetical protein